MDQIETHAVPAAVLCRLERATNEHDLEALVACFASDYRNETPAHPERGFTGRDQVRATGHRSSPRFPTSPARFWAARSTAIRCGASGSIGGTRPDGTPHLMRGVIIFGVADGLAAWARFYLEPVQAAAGTVDQAVRQQVMPDGRS